METTVHDWIDAKLDEESQWQTVALTPEIKQLVECDVCNHLNEPKRHILKGQFTPTCPRCRRRRTMREAKAKVRLKQKIEKAALLQSKAQDQQLIENELLAQLNVRISENQARLDSFNRRLAEGSLARWETDLLGRRKKIRNLLHDTRQKIRDDVKDGKHHPFPYYMNKIGVKDDEEG